MNHIKQLLTSVLNTDTVIKNGRRNNVVLLLADFLCGGTFYAIVHLSGKTPDVCAKLEFEFLRIKQCDLRNIDGDICCHGSLCFIDVTFVEMPPHS